MLCIKLGIKFSKNQVTGSINSIKSGKIVKSKLDATKSAAQRHLSL